MTILKGVAILFMLLLHLFCRKDVNGLYETYPTINGIPFVYYIGLFGDACVSIYCFASGYGLYISINNEQKSVLKRNLERIFKLLVNYWIILVMFVIVGFLVGKSDLYPGSLSKFLLNFFTLSYSYNGAWWFLQTYIILVLLAPLLVSLIKKYNTLLLISITGVIYLLSYIQRIKHIYDFGGNVYINAVVNSIVLLGTSLLPFVIGSVFAKEKIYTKMSLLIHKVPFKNTICLLGILLLVFIHSRIETLFIAPFTAIPFICLFTIIKKGKRVQNSLEFFGKHSTNIWLTHMFFYGTLFQSLVFAPKYPVLIFTWLLILCLISSWFINLLFKPIVKLIDKVASTIKNNQKTSSDYLRL
ncbi:acyltransferase [Paenibacillus sp. GCM10023248]|uniref:acyltransferase family protein n=1 Tax=unclassified Paenibacillus TaxID=185978 RepID=UPI0023785112|nr:acyltransferase [Paenibacillus sp. MAHUQ-63]MDD9266523.1 acyltransferase [Paenibacillus sp. MAHUQ-63]